MGEKTDIQWCDSTINPTSGCDGCELYKPDHGGRDDSATCYAKRGHEMRLARSIGEPKYAPIFNQVRMIPGRCTEAAAWPSLKHKERKGKPWLDGLRRHIFVGDMGDFLSRAVTDEFLSQELRKAILSARGQRHVWLLLTKRPRRLAQLADAWGGLPENVVAMTSVTCWRTAQIRIPELLKVRAMWRGLSCEPLLGRVDISWALTQIHWVITGGESGAGSRPMDPAWALSLRDQCQDAGVPFFFKQWGSHTSEGAHMDKYQTGRLLEGREWNGMPALGREALLTP